MRVSWLVLFLGLLGAVPAGCGSGRYRLGGERDTAQATGGGPGREGSGGANALGRGGQSFGGTGSEDAGATGFAGSSGGEIDAGSAGAGVRAPLLDGSVDPPDGAPLTRDVTRIVSTQQGIAFLASDERYLYFNNWGGSVWRTDHAGAGLEKLAEDESYHLVADATHLYWTSNTSIRRVAKAGGLAEVVSILKPDAAAHTAFALWLALDESHVYCSTYDGQTVVRAPKTGGPYEVMARSASTMGGVAVNDGALYYTEYDFSGSTYRVDLATRVSEAFLPAGAAALRVVANDLWFAIANANGFGTLVRAPLDGGSITGYTVADYLLPFESDGIHMYWVGRDLFRIHIDTRAQEIVATSPIFDISHIAFTADWIFLSSMQNPGGIVRIPKPPP